MALADPQKVTIKAVETTLPRVSTGAFNSIYESSDGNTVLRLSTVENSRKRQVVRIDKTKITEDPFIPSQNTEVSMSAYLVIDRPKVGYTNEEAEDIVTGLLALITASENLVLTKLLGSES